MCFEDKIEELKAIIKATLTPYIDNDFVLFDLPYHTNIGDNLIWEGEIQFLKELTNHRLLYYCNAATYHSYKIDKHIIILLHGGGNFGDVWYETHYFKEKIIASYPDNKIIILPQTVWYTDKNILAHDVTVYSAQSNLILCARDRKSYELLKKYFINNTILLVPDMAFCIPPAQLQKYQCKPSSTNLFLKRSDKELNIALEYSDYINENGIEISDWPTMQKQTVCIFFLRCFVRISRSIKILFPLLTDLYAALFFKRSMIKTGVRFISTYNKVYTTRLHGAILCCLLDKPFVFFDNSYGKNRSFFETWLQDLDGAEFHECQ